MKIIDGIPVWGEPLQNAVDQMKNCMRPENGACKAALMADHHLGYAVPIGGVLAYRDAISPSGVGFDIACGNKAVLTDASVADVRQNISKIMDDVVRAVSFGIGRVNNEPVDHPLFEDPAWDIPAAAAIKQKAAAQLGTVGSGNHYVDIFEDEQGRVWIGVHFGSRGFGHGIASHYIKAGGGKDGINVDPVVLAANTDLGREYIACMNLAGRYAYAGRDWVCERVAKILGAKVLDEVHNHHNFAWKERHFACGIRDEIHAEWSDLWVVRKGATPAFPDQRGFVGGTMGEKSVILQGLESGQGPASLYSTVHGAGRRLSRTEAAGKMRKGKRVSHGLITPGMMDEWVAKAGVELRGAGVDESPHCYKRLPEVLAAQGDTIKVIHTLSPIGVAMAGAHEVDPYKD